MYVVDLASSLLKVVEKRAAQRNWNNVQAITADATTWTPPEGSADVVTFSYSLTMIPDWFAAIDNAMRILKPGGLIGIIDFYVARKYPEKGSRNMVGPLEIFGQSGFRMTMFFPPQIICPT